MEAVMHPLELFAYAFISALLLLCLVFAVGRWIGRKKWKRIKKSSMGNTATVDMGQQVEE